MNALKVVPPAAKIANPDALLFPVQACGPAAPAHLAQSEAKAAAPVIARLFDELRSAGITPLQLHGVSRINVETENFCFSLSGRRKAPLLITSKCCHDGERCAKVNTKGEIQGPKLMAALALTELTKAIPELIRKA